MEFVQTNDKELTLINQENEEEVILVHCFDVLALAIKYGIIEEDGVKETFYYRPINDYVVIKIR